MLSGISGSLYPQQFHASLTKTLARQSKCAIVQMLFLEKSALVRVSGNGEK
jgi:hypothetical protein